MAEAALVSRGTTVPLSPTQAVFPQGPEIRVSSTKGEEEDTVLDSQVHMSRIYIRGGGGGHPQGGQASSASVGRQGREMERRGMGSTCKGLGQPVGPGGRAPYKHASGDHRGVESIGSRPEERCPADLLKF